MPSQGQALVRKPGAFAHYRFREQLFPTMNFQRAYDALWEWRGERADMEFVRILHLLKVYNSLLTVNLAAGVDR